MVDILGFLSMYLSQTTKHTDQKQICFEGWLIGLNTTEADSQGDSSVPADGHQIILNKAKENKKKKKVEDKQIAGK